MDISENELKCRILEGQIEIVNEVITDLNKQRQNAILFNREYTAAKFEKVVISWSKYLTTLKRELQDYKERIKIES